ncbi:MAG: hypothetical protein U1F14_11670 [Steroidobacteraceae bacterium]
MNSSRRSIWVRLAPVWLLALSMLFAAGVAEVALRLFPGLLPEEAQLRLLWSGERDDMLTVGHPQVGVLYKPLQHKRMQNRDFDIEVSTDEYGFRNKSPWPARAEIVAVGDSLVFGYGVDHAVTWTSLLEARVGKRVINLGMAGSGPGQYTRYFEHFGMRVRPRVLLYGLYPNNDIQDVEDFDRWIEAGSPGNYDEFRLFSGDIPSTMKTFMDESYLAVALRIALKNLRDNSRFKAQTIELRDGKRVRLVPRLDDINTPRMTESNPAFTSMLRSIDRARELARGIDARMICVIFPSKSRVYLSTNGEDFRGPADPLITSLRARGYEVLDLTDVLREHAARGEQVYFETDGHPNELGNRIIADRVYEYLQASPPVPAGL